MEVGGLGWPVTATLCGLVGGAIANSCIDRLPHDQPLARGLLTCPSCGSRGSLIDALPILGWIAAGGRCRSCRRPISTQQPVVEALNAVLWLLIAGAMEPSPRALVLMFLVTALLILSLIDLEHHLLPDLITLPGILLGLGATWLPGWPVTFLDAALSAGIGYFAMMALAKAAEMYYREEALGQGDWKMVAMLGAFLGSSKLAIVVLAANLAGALVGLLLVTLLGSEGRRKLPLGTFLGASGVVVVMI